MSSKKPDKQTEEKYFMFITSEKNKILSDKELRIVRSKINDFVRSSVFRFDTSNFEELGKFFDVLNELISEDGIRPELLLSHIIANYFGFETRLIFTEGLMKKFGGTFGQKERY